MDKLFVLLLPSLLFRRFSAVRPSCRHLKQLRQEEAFDVAALRQQFLLLLKQIKIVYCVCVSDIVYNFLSPI